MNPRKGDDIHEAIFLFASSKLLEESSFEMNFFCSFFLFHFFLSLGHSKGHSYGAQGGGLGRIGAQGGKT